MKTRSKTMKVREPLWLFTDNGNNQTHKIHSPGEKVKVFRPMGEYAYVYDESFGFHLSAILTHDDMLKYFGTDPFEAQS